MESLYWKKIPFDLTQTCSGARIWILFLSSSFTLQEPQEHQSSALLLYQNYVTPWHCERCVLPIGQAYPSRMRARPFQEEWWNLDPQQDKDIYRYNVAETGYFSAFHLNPDCFPVCNALKTQGHLMTDMRFPESTSRPKWRFPLQAIIPLVKLTNALGDAKLISAGL